jgi:hypothetical protein
MDPDKKPTTSRCKKLPELPPVLTDWQQTAWCPECDYYDYGICVNPIRRDSNAACPFDGKVLPLREVALEAPHDHPGEPLDVGFSEVRESLPWSKALEQAVKHRIVDRTGGRIRALAIDLTDRELVVRGTAPCYYVKQLALQGVLEVLQSDQETKVRFNFQVVVCPPGPRE